MAASDKAPVVCDNGTGFVKCGFAGDNFPIGSFPSMIGRPTLRQESKLSKAVKLKDIMIGQEAENAREFLEISYPMENGIVRDWDDMKILWDFTFESVLKINPKDHKILLTEPPSNPKKNRKKMYTNMFEVYGFEAAIVQLQAVLVLYAQGLLTGVVLDSGDGVSHVIPVYEGYGMPNLIQRLNVAGRHVTRQLIALLQVRGYNLNRSADFDTARMIKEQLCYAAFDPAKEQQLASDTTVLVKEYKLPDGRVLKIGRERFMAAEVLFDPAKYSFDGKGMAEMIYSAINTASIDLRADFYKHIVLSGGTTMFAGLPSRLEKDLKDLWLERIAKGDKKRLKKFQLKIEDPPRRKNMVFLGGAVLGDIMKDKEDFWITKEEWEELGPTQAMIKHNQW